MATMQQPTESWSRWKSILPAADTQSLCNQTETPANHTDTESNHGNSAATHRDFEQREGDAPRSNKAQDDGRSSATRPTEVPLHWENHGNQRSQTTRTDRHFFRSAVNPGGTNETKLRNAAGGCHDAMNREPTSHAPKLPSVSVSLSGEIVEDTSVTLICSSDANPAANYTWYKKNEDPDLQPLSKEPQLVFSSNQSSDSGEYYCTAENELGKRCEHIFIDVKLKTGFIMNIVRLTLLFLMLILLLPFSLWMRKKRTLRSTTEQNEPAETIEFDSSVMYENASDLQVIAAAQTEDTEDYDDPVQDQVEG